MILLLLQILFSFGKWIFVQFLFIINYWKIYRYWIFIYIYFDILIIGYILYKFPDLQILYDSTVGTLAAPSLKRAASKFGNNVFDDIFSNLHRPKVARKAWIKHNELNRFLRTTIWVTRTGELTDSYRLLMRRIGLLWSKSGTNFTFMYLKESLRLTVRHLAGSPETDTFNKILVKRDRFGLPTIIPLKLRQFFVKEDWLKNRRVIVCILTLLSVFRVMPTKVKPDLSSIEDEFTGLSSSLPVKGIKLALVDLFGKRLKKRLKGPRLLKSESAGPNSIRSSWGAGIDAIAFIHHPKHLMWMWRWCKFHRCIIWFVWLIFLIVLSFPVYIVLWIFAGKDFDRLKLGRLAVVSDQAGKARIVAITNWWLQLFLKPLHDALSNSLRKLETDGTFNQEAPLSRLIDIAMSTSTGAPDQNFSCFDLSAATDRLPISLQTDILSFLIGKSSIAWKEMLDIGWVYDGRTVRYAVGQPMGAYSSFAMLAVTHHVIVIMAAHRAGINNFRNYAVLGDDIVIYNDVVASEYLTLMNSLGLNINQGKSVISKDFAEFAKRLRGPKIDFTPLGPGLILRSFREKFYLGRIISEALKLALIDSHGVLVLLRSLGPSWDYELVKALWVGLGPGRWSLPRSHNDVDFTILWCSNGAHLSPDLWRAALYKTLLELSIERCAESAKQLEREELYFYKNWYRVFSSSSWPTRILEFLLKPFNPGFWAYSLSFLRENENISSMRDMLLNLNEGYNPSSVTWDDVQNLWTLSPSINISTINWAEKKKIKDIGNNIALMDIRVRKKYEELIELDLFSSGLFYSSDDIPDNRNKDKVDPLTPSFCFWLFLWFFLLWNLFSFT